MEILTVPPTRRTRNHADLALEDLAMENQLLREHNASLQADVAMYREVAQCAIHANHDLVVKLDRLRARQHRLLNDIRHLRDQTRQTTAEAPDTTVPLLPSVVENMRVEAVH